MTCLKLSAPATVGRLAIPQVTVNLVRKEEPYSEPDRPKQ